MEGDSNLLVPGQLFEPLMDGDNVLFVPGQLFEPLLEPLTFEPLMEGDSVLFAPHTDGKRLCFVHNPH